MKLPSVKNFQLVSPTNTGDVLVQFGKVDDDTFHLDFKVPCVRMIELVLVLKFALSDSVILLRSHAIPGPNQCFPSVFHGDCTIRLLKGG